MRTRVGLSLALALTACAASGDNTAPSTSTRATVTQPTTPPAPECPPATSERPAFSEGGGDYTLVALDGTFLRLHWFPAGASTAPTLLQSPGWASDGATSDSPTQGLFGSLSISALRAKGYNVLTWDRRGFGESGGVVDMGSPATEGGDVVAIVDWVARQPEARLDAPGDPRVGMFGGSYGGGIQLVAAALDCRIDAITPHMSWHSWRTALYRGDIPKLGWINLLFSSALEADLDPRFVELVEAANEATLVDAKVVDFLDALGPGDLVDHIRAPTLLLQGTVDNLFTLDEASATFESLQARGIPSAMLWYCGGHGVCPIDTDDGAWAETATLAWLDYYVRDDHTVTLPPTFETVDADGTRWRMQQRPEPSSSLTGTGSGTLALTAASHAGPPDTLSDGTDGMTDAMASVSPAIAEVAVDVDVASSIAGLVVGSPRVEITYRGTPGAGDGPTRVFAQIVDPMVGRVVGGQITPIPVVLDGATHSTVVQLETIVHRLREPADRLVLQIVATTALYSTPQLGGTITFDRIDVELPVVDRLIQT
jgi:ABC-2 type transport system ATP-binding protein